MITHAYAWEVQRTDFVLKQTETDNAKIFRSVTPVGIVAPEMFGNEVFDVRPYNCRQKNVRDLLIIMNKYIGIQIFFSIQCHSFQNYTNSIQICMLTVFNYVQLRPYNCMHKNVRDLLIIMTNIFFNSMT